MFTGTNLSRDEKIGKCVSMLTFHSERIGRAVSMEVRIIGKCFHAHVPLERIGRAVRIPNHRSVSMHTFHWNELFER